MFRVPAVSALCAVLLALNATGAPVPRESMRPPVPLAGSVWEGDGVDGPTVYEFHETGRMSTTYPRQRSENIGTWQQDGTRIYWETCDHYCEFEGTLSGTAITGRAWNKPGGKWTLTFKRKSSQPAK
ncbi:MAG: hypothetical protein J0I06_23270 [Planctomycetes bacterium]|nr:hypothetical protein [Planctomycetota bacterium]